MKQQKPARLVRLLLLGRSAFLAVALAALLLAPPRMPMAYPGYTYSPWPLRTALASAALWLCCRCALSRLARRHFFCPHCGVPAAAFAAAWLHRDPGAQCPHCGKWVTLVELDVEPPALKRLPRPVETRRWCLPVLRALRLASELLLVALLLAAVAVLADLWPYGPRAYDLLQLLTAAVVLALQCVFAHLARRFFRCPHCGFYSPPYAYKAAGLRRPAQCPHCGSDFKNKE